MCGGFYSNLQRPYALSLRKIIIHQDNYQEVNMFFSSNAISLNKTLLPKRFSNQQITPLVFFGQRELLVPDLFKLMGNRQYKSFYDPFSGSGSISFAAMQAQFSNLYYINDSDPVFKHIWQSIKDSPQSFIEDYSRYVEGYLNHSVAERAVYYNRLQDQFNQIKRSGTYKNAETIFVFLINFAKNNIPVFGTDLDLATEPNVNIITEKENKALADFRKRTLHLSTLLNQNNVVFISGDFNACLATVTQDDFVLLDPPYPTQSKNIYFKIKSEEALQNAIRATFDELNKRNVDFMILYGATTVSLNNQFDEERYNVHHLVRLSTSKIYGDGLEHVYISRRIHLTPETLPTSMGFYHTYFERNIEMSDKKYKEVLKELQTKRDSLHQTPTLRSSL
ncbi:MAG: hypothetical protein A3F18_07210 [Legionellales bacterium RIFCSPHIGHO2_12_FULL_37_14]|nr:MAG: hypothetical protein A3F18_07210 [Legionellales bacterium RIFCSPHIGHO2_12_FULL_37_14]